MDTATAPPTAAVVGCFFIMVIDGSVFRSLVVVVRDGSYRDMARLVLTSPLH